MEALNFMIRLLIVLLLAIFALFAIIVVVTVIREMWDEHKREKKRMAAIREYDKEHRHD